MQRESHGIPVYITSDHVSTCLPLICGLVVKRAVSKTSWLLHLFWLLQGLAGSSASLSSFLMYAVAASFPLGCCEKLVNPYIKYENIVELIVSIQIQASSLILFSWLFICNSSDPSIRFLLLGSWFIFPFSELHCIFILAFHSAFHCFLLSLPLIMRR